MMKPSLIERVLRRIARSRANRRHRLSCNADSSTVFLGTALLINHQAPEAIRIGAQCIVGGELLVFPDGGRIHVGDHCFIGGGTRIWSGVDINIGNRVLISHGVNVHDSISHSLSAAERHRHFLDIAVDLNPALGKVRKQSVVIEDDAWIGLNAIVLKGVRIGRGAIVAAGAIVTEDVAPFTVVGGPAAGPIGHSYE